MIKQKTIQSIQHLGTGQFGRRDVLRQFASLPVGMALASSALPLLLSEKAQAQFQMPSPFGSDVRDYRWTRIREFMAKHGLDCLIIPKGAGDGVNQLQFAEYASNGFFFNPGAVVFPAKGDPAVIGTLPMPTDWISRTTSREKDNKQTLVGDNIVDLVKEMGYEQGNIGTLGTQAGVEGYNEFINEGLPKYATWKRVLEGLPKVNFVDLTAEFAAMMMVKSKTEQEAIIASATVGERLTEKLHEVAGVGVPVKDFKVAVEEFLIRNDATADVRAFMAPPGNFHDGQLINAEYGVIYKGGYSQVTICIAAGKVSKQTEQLAAVAHEAMDYGLENLRAGKRFGDVVEPMAKIIWDAGYWNMVPVIHGLAPMHAVAQVSWGRTKKGAFSTLAKDMLIEPGMSFSFEPGAIQGVGPMASQVKVGGTAIVTADGINMINKLGLRMQRAS